MSATSASGKPITAPYVSPNGQNLPGDSVTIFGYVTAVSGNTASTNQCTVTLLLANSGNSVTVPGQDCHGNDSKRVPLLNTEAHATGVLRFTTVSDLTRKQCERELAEAAKRNWKA
jgi:hypothetical protein